MHNERIWDNSKAYKVKYMISLVSFNLIFGSPWNRIIESSRDEEIKCSIGGCEVCGSISSYYPGPTLDP